MARTAPNLTPANASKVRAQGGLPFIRFTSASVAARTCESVFTLDTFRLDMIDVAPRLELAQWTSHQ